MLFLHLQFKTVEAFVVAEMPIRRDNGLSGRQAHYLHDSPDRALLLENAAIGVERKPLGL
jgi:hypothetical protein